MTEEPEAYLTIVDRLLAAHEAYYDVERDVCFAGEGFDGFAELHSSLSRFVLSKRAKLWETSSHEYIFFKAYEQLDAQEFDRLVSLMKERGFGKVVLDEDHMSSYVTLIVVAGSVAGGLASKIRRTRHRKNYAFGLKGWADLRVCVIDLDGETVHSNAQGRDLVPSLEANAFPAIRRDRG